MGIGGKIRAAVGCVPRASVRRELHRFLNRTRDCRATQLDVLQSLLRLNSGSDFSSSHDFDAVRTVDEFRRRIPVVDFEYFRPAIEDLKAGRFQSLLGPKNRLLMFSLSSGTTAESKCIPITKKFLSDYRRGWQIWGIQVLDDHPNINSRHIVQLSSSFSRYRTAADIPCGNISGLVAAMQKRIVRSMYTVPGTVAEIQDPAARQYTVLRLTLADRQAALMMTANPSTLIQMAGTAGDKAEQLIHDIADGSLDEKVPVPAHVRKALRRRLRRRPQRARELNEILDRTGRLDPRECWPELELIAIWTGGSSGAYLPKLRELYGDVAVRDHGLSASEGRMTIPLQDTDSSGVLDLTTHFFEFIPVAEYGGESPVVLSAHELEEGGEYYVLLTTSSGLCRYDICDVVRCTGFFNTTPRLEFLHKGAHISNLTGEKITESQVVNAVRRTMEKMQMQLSQFTVAPEWGDPPQYRLLLEEREMMTPTIGKALAEHVDRELQSANCEYGEKRASERLGALELLPLPPGTWNRYCRHRQGSIGGSVEQYKHPCLAPDLEFCENVLKRFSKPNDPTGSRRSA